MTSDLRSMWEAAGGRVPENWRFQTIESLLEHQKSIAVGVMYPGPDTADGVPLIKVSDIKNGEVQGKPSFCISREVDEEYKRTRLRGDELLITLVGEPGDCVIATDEMAGWNTARAVAVVKLMNPDLRPWLRFVLLSAPAKHLIGTRLNTTVQKTLNLKDIRELGVPLPPEACRNQIIGMLSSLDKKIALNRKQNETLEAMARALFKAWFVDFEPVRAKMEGRWQRGQSLPGLPAHLYDLFPDRLVDSEPGEIPEGWEVSSIGEEVSVFGGSTPSTKEPAYWVDGQHHWATPKDLSGLKFPVLLDTDRKVTDAGLAKISSGLLPAGTVLMSSRAPIGYLAITEIPTAVNQGFIAMKCESRLSNVFVLAWCHQNMDAITGNANGSTFQEISKKNFRPIPVIVPSAPVLEHYNLSANALYRKMVEKERESITLAQLRDTLLPKLISGELRVANLDRECLA